MSARSIRYVVSAPRRSDHLLHVVATFRADTLPEPFVVAMPVWTPGSYLVREHARHIESLTAHSALGLAGVRKLRKNVWAIAHGGASELTVTYTVYAHELTVRTSHVDDAHVYFNGAGVFVHPLDDAADWRAVPCSLELPAMEPDGDVATQLARDADGVYHATDFDHLVDSPVHIGKHTRVDFTVAERTHSIVVWGSSPAMDLARLARDVAKVVEVEQKVFGEAPYTHYTFMLMLVPGTRSGLEHADSAVLMASPDAFDTDEGYVDLLALFAHEFWHLWQVKRTRPAGLVPYDYNKENHTRLLWLFEGGTSYYDWLVLRRAGLVTVSQYLRHLGGEIARLQDTPGRLLASLEDASFDAWTRLYRPDEYSPNVSVSYYLKGEVVCALLDLEIRARSQGQRSLDDVMRRLWEHHGRTGVPVPESGVEALFAAATELDLSASLHDYTRTTELLPYDTVLVHVGLQLRWRPGRGASLGVRLRTDNSKLWVHTVYRDSAADRAGIAPGDEVIALDARRVDEASLRQRLRHARPTQAFALLVARREMLRELHGELDAPPADGVDIVPMEAAAPELLVLAEGWLGGTVPLG